MGRGQDEQNADENCELEEETRTRVNMAERGLHRETYQEAGEIDGPRPASQRERAAFRETARHSIVSTLGRDGKSHDLRSLRPEYADDDRLEVAEHHGDGRRRQNSIELHRQQGQSRSPVSPLS